MFLYDRCQYIPGIITPKGVAVNPRTNRIYVSSRDKGIVYVVDSLFNTVIDEIPVCSEPFGVEVNSQTNKIYVACFNSGRVAVISGATNTVIDSVQVGPEPTYIGINELTNRIYVVTHGNNGLVEINGFSDERTEISGMDAGAWSVAIDETRDRAYVTNRDTGSVIIVDTDKMDTVKHIYPGDGRESAWAVGYNPVSDRLYVSFTDRGLLTKVAVYEPSGSTLNRLATIDVPNGGTDAGGRMGINPHTNHIFVTSAKSDVITVIDGANNKVIATIPMGSEPFGVDVNPVTDRAYVGSKDSHQLWVVPDTW